MIFEHEYNDYRFQENLSINFQHGYLFYSTERLILLSNIFPYYALSFVILIGIFPPTKK